MKRFRVKLEIRLKDGILDAEGMAIEKAIRRFGVEAENTRKGKIIEFTTTGKSEEEVIEKVKRLTHELLINPLTEEYTLEVKGEEA